MKFKKKLLMGIEVTKAKLFKKKIPIVISWAITNRCNQRCKYCGGWKKKTNELSTKQVFSIIDQLKLLGCIQIIFTGGEPLLRNDIVNIVDYCKKNDILVRINSNGSLLKERVNDIKNVSSLTLSLDGPEKIQDQLKSKGSYKQIIDAIEIAKKNNINLSFITVISKQNLEYLEYVIKIAKKYGISVYFQPVYLIYHLQNIERFKPSAESYKRRIDWLINLKKNSNCLVGNSLPGLRHLRNWPKPNRIKCANLIRYRIEPNGDIYPCGRLVGKINPQNCITIGLEEAINRTNITSCNYCWCARDVELNLAYSLNISVITNLLKTMLK